MYNGYIFPIFRRNTVFRKHQDGLTQIHNITSQETILWLLWATNRIHIWSSDESQSLQCEFICSHFLWCVTSNETFITL